jgi:hypothetical protein
MNMINRRQFLNSSSGLALAPFLHHMQLHAAGDAALLPKRFVFVVRGNGLRPFGVVPDGLEDYGSDKFRADTLIDRPLADLTLNESMRALTPFKSQMSIIQGLSSKVCKGPHGGHYGVLGAYASGDHAPPRKATLDAILSRKFPSIFPHLAFHIGITPGELFRYLKISAQGKNTRTPAYASPMLAYKEIFGTVLTGDSAKMETAAHRNLMDFLVSDVKRVRKGLNANEKEKLDHYLHGFETLRDREVKLTKMGPSLGKHAPPLSDAFSSDIETHRLDAHFDLASAALITGLTNVVTIRADQLELRYQGFDHERMKSISLHEIGHTADVEGQTDRFNTSWKLGREMRGNIRRFQMELLAGMATKLQAVPEGDGTMLDNTLIVFLSDAGSAHHTGYENMPLVVIGNMNKALKTGRYLHVPSYNNSGHRVLANFLMSLQHAAGVPSDDFGDKDLGLGDAIDQRGALTELMA